MQRWKNFIFIFKNKKELHDLNNYLVFQKLKTEIETLCISFSEHSRNLLKTGKLRYGTTIPRASV